MSSFVSVRDKDEKYQFYKIPEEVSLYIKQLEAFIKYPNDSKLLSVYPDRFLGVKNQQQIKCPGCGIVANNYPCGICGKFYGSEVDYGNV